MTPKEIRLAAREKITNGQSKQQVFAELQNKGTDTQSLVTYISYIPSATAKKRYKYLNFLLSILLVVAAVVQIIVASQKIAESGNYYYMFLFIIYPGIMLAGVYYALTFTPYVHRHIFTGCLILLMKVITDEWPIVDTPLHIFDFIICTILSGLSAFLAYKIISREYITKERVVDDTGKRRLKLLVNFRD